MSDGIIQEVYKKIAVPLIIEIDGNDVPMIPQDMVDDAFKELIEKIKQELNEYGIIEHANAYPCHQIGYIREKLIGDNNV